MAKFVYNIAKNASTILTLFGLNCTYYLRVSFEEDVDPRSRLRSTDKLAGELKELIKVCYQNFFYTKKLQKKAYDKEVKNHSYALSKKT